jgi:antitoxin FitA
MRIAERPAKTYIAKSVINFVEDRTMRSVTIRKVPDEVHRAIKLRAARHGRSAEAEMREILEQAVNSETPKGFGRNLSEDSRAAGLTNEDFVEFEKILKEIREEARQSYKPITFE